VVVVIPIFCIREYILIWTPSPLPTKGIILGSPRKYLKKTSIRVYVYAAGPRIITTRDKSTTAQKPLCAV
jgi:hypothetical protein